eukprot:13433251-Ditylum_brightwellii.AAC.1
MDMSQPINAYFTKIDECIQFATNGKTPFKAGQILTAATYEPAVDRTWEKFKTFFADEYAELCKEEQLTAKELHFQQANVMQNVSEALDNLARDIIAERNTMQELVTSNKVLTESNTLLAEQVKIMQNQYLQSKELIKEVRDNKKTWRPKTEWDPHGYCWSCGYQVTRNHNSVTCLHKKEGHKDTATRSNNMGGSQRNKPRGT